ncbi:ABC transporter permease [Enterococcus sp. BWR-S5]|uniref:ABC transporter permease n=1 Tax=Enterococcus sp. BWR-S5 TaxID=2787714 RepID=UPI0019230BCE|nr:ABC transporter permease [Enterococcus sp. BWR-S5]MBL1226783.1 ABC transporter permease [Enterococcus sp. BWR-S5]
MLYSRLAYNNLKKNRTVYIPFGLATIFTVVLNIIMQVMLHNEGMNSLPQAMSVKAMFSFGSVVIMVFSVVFTFYTHSFLIKRRKKELGLYNILGMDKGNLTIMMLFENLYTFLIVMVGGVISGVIFSKLMFLVLKKLTGFGNEFVFDLSLASLLRVVSLFAGIFLVTFLYDMWEVRKTKPIELLGQAKSGEKEPKAKWILAILGIGCLAAGYGISLTIQSPVEALTLFFVAVILVIIGTYSLFVAGSITLLKFLKNRESFYYKPSNFISISSMIFRMKQNGAGLATICILCTMALVTISTTVSLYVGREDMIKNRNPFQNSISANLPAEEVEAMVEETAQANQTTVKNLQYITSSSNVVTVKKSTGVYQPEAESISNYGSVNGFQFIKVSEYNRVEQTNEQLNQNEVILYPVYGGYDESTITVGSQTFTVKDVPEEFVLSPKKEDETLKGFLVFVPDEQFEQILTAVEQDFEKSAFTFSRELETSVLFELDGSVEKRVAVVEALRNEFNVLAQQAGMEELDVTVSSIDEDRESNRVMMGGFLFIGVIFGLSFIIATTLIIFYKQISEGNDDHDRFEIMQKVGLSHKEVHKTIQHQILLVFFLPIVVAVIHLSFAFPIIKKLLVLFGLTNGSLLLMTTTICVGIFVLCYFIIYWRTSKVYYRLVER